MAGSSAIDSPRRREALEGCFFLVDDGDHNVARVRDVHLLYHRNVAVKDAGLDHAVAPHFEREMIARREQVGGQAHHLAPRLNRFDGSTGSDASHDRHRDRMAPFVLRCRAHPAEIALDDAGSEPARARAAHPVRNRFRKLDHLDGARAIRQAPNEAAFLKRRNEAMNARLRAQVERVLHLVK